MGVEKNVAVTDGSMRNALYELKWTQMERKDVVRTACCSFIIRYGGNFVLILIFPSVFLIF